MILLNPVQCNGLEQFQLRLLFSVEYYILAKKDISFQKQYSNIAIEESNWDVALLVDSYPSMFLPPLGDLSHPSILYCCIIIVFA